MVLYSASFRWDPPTIWIDDALRAAAAGNGDPAAVHKATATPTAVAGASRIINIANKFGYYRREAFILDLGLQTI